MQIVDFIWTVSMAFDNMLLAVPVQLTFSLQIKGDTL